MCLFVYFALIKPLMRQLVSFIILITTIKDLPEVVVQLLFDRSILFLRLFRCIYVVPCIQMA